MTETLHVLATGGATPRSMDSMDELDAGRGVTVELAIPEVLPHRAAARFRGSGTTRTAAAP